MPRAERRSLPRQIERPDDKPGITSRQADANLTIIFRRATELAIGTLSVKNLTKDS
jgi:hypothetical protein